MYIKKANCVKKAYRTDNPSEKQFISNLPLRKALGKGGKTATAWGQEGIAPTREHQPTTT